MVPIPSGKEYSFSYDLMFENGWEWVRGGKLPGLAATVHDSGCSQSPGTDKWSARIMWRADADNETYVYRQGRAPGVCGDRTASNRKFVVGSYQAVTVYVKVNSTASTSDGIVRLYINGALAAEQSGVKFRAVGTTASEVSNIMFSTFFGGTNKAGDATWSPSKTVYARFDNLVVTPGLRVRAAPGM
ncbi:polysaccharide lyase [Uliginosibacterium sp. H1]|uniref:polysaccharide lyase n=1 Tax=Uliginosibacterium sp. H1 TaxID=3114757 RepID=UPI002E198054|nr:hypothetical protein [Uliginosibacterium sp. H1]